MFVRLGSDHVAMTRLAEITSYQNSKVLNKVLHLVAKWVFSWGLMFTPKGKTALLLQLKVKLRYFDHLQATFKSSCVAIKSSLVFAACRHLVSSANKQGNMAFNQVEK